MQQSIARLGKEVTTLKASLDAANKSAHTQIAKIADRLEHAQAEHHRFDFGAADGDPAPHRPGAGAAADAASAHRRGGGHAARAAR